jgi:hypothetical protein
MDDSETFKALQMLWRRAALTRLTPLSYFEFAEIKRQFSAKLLLAHFKHKPLLAHPSADVSVDGARASRRTFPFRLFLAAS